MSTDNDHYLKYYDMFRIRYVNLKRQVPLILVFDFDNTITKVSIPSMIFSMKDSYNKSCQKIINKYGIKNLMSGIFLDNGFKQYLREIKHTHNAKIIITSYGIKECINIFLEKMEMSDIFDKVITPVDFNLEEGFDHFGRLQGKNVMIQKYAKAFNISNNKIMLIDDSFKNIRIANKNNYKTSFVKNRNGMTKNNLTDINKFVNSILVSK